MRKIYSKLPLLAMLVGSFTIQAQQDSIRGKVMDAYGNPMRSVSVISDTDFNNKAVTDKNGMFALSGKIGDVVLIETPDQKKKNVPVESLNMSIIVDNESRMLNLGYDVQVRAEESTAAISVITSEEIMHSTALNPANALIGKGLGLTLLQNGGTVWESNPSGSIRGLESLLGNNMLVVVDGFERNLNQLVKEEIESVQVLKDAAATALYGLKGANGVLYVTTKTGKRSGVDININYEHTINTIARMPKFADGNRYASALNEALANDGLDPLYDQTQLNGIANGDPHYGNVNWVDEVLNKNGSSNNVYLTLQGGSPIAKYFAVVDYYENKGFLKPENIVDGYSSQLKYSKLNVRTNIDVQLTKSTELSYKMNGLLSEHNRPGALSNEIMGLIYNTPSAAFPVKTPYGDWGGSDIWTRNPVATVAATGYARSHVRSLFADLTIKQSLGMFVKGLTVDARIGYDNLAEFWDTYGMKYSYAVPTVAHPASKDDYKKVGESSAATFGSSLGAQVSRFNLVGRANYARTFNRIHQLNATIGVASEQSIYSGQHTTTNRVNIFGNAHYAYKGKYIADVALARQGSNKLSPNNRFGTFPAISAAWILSKENFMQDVSAISFLKLRASWGIAGSDITPEALLWREKYGWANGAIIGNNYTGTDGLGEGRLPSQVVGYEKSNKSNIGLDATFFGMLDLTVEAFNHDRTDMLITPGDVSSLVGARLPYENLGKANNKGIEMGLNFHHQIEDFKFNIGGNFTFNRNTILEMGEEYKPYEWMKQTGSSIGQQFGYVAIGYYKDQADVDDLNNPKQKFSNVKPGDIKYKDLNGDGFIDEFDVQAIGSNNMMPEIYYSANLGVEYKGIGIDALIQGVSNYTTISSTSSLFWPLSGNSNISDHYYENRWTPENPDAKYPRLSQGTNANNFQANTLWLTDRSYIKLRHAEVYYKFPTSLLSKTFIRSAKLYVRASDIILFDHVKVCDPEAMSAVYPIPSNIQFGVSVGF